MLYSTVPAHEKRRLFRERLASGELLRFPGAVHHLDTSVFNFTITKE
jgi:methylisocitrate lyase